MSLLITWRIRHVPPSGANVRPVRRTFWISLAMPDGERVDPQRRQREADVAAALLLVHEAGDEAVDPREVGGRERRERDLVVAGAAQAVAHHRAHLVGGALADGPGDHPGLAEAAAAGAAAEHLDVEAVVHHLDERHELLLRVGPLGEVGDGALVDAVGHVAEPRAHLGDERAVVVDLVHRRARRRRGSSASSRSTPSRAVRPERFHAPTTSVISPTASSPSPITKASTKSAIGSGLNAQWPPTIDERVLRAALLGPHRHAGEVEALEHVRVDELGGEAEGEHVEAAGVVVGVDREERHRRPAASPRSCRPRARRRARPPRRHVRSGSRRGSGAPGWAGRSRRYRDRRGARRCWTAGAPAGGCPAPSRCSERASRPWPVGARPSATGLTSGGDPTSRPGSPSHQERTGVSQEGSTRTADASWS